MSRIVESTLSELSILLLFVFGIISLSGTDFFSSFPNSGTVKGASAPSTLPVNPSEIDLEIEKLRDKSIPKSCLYITLQQRPFTRNFGVNNPNTNKTSYWVVLKPRSAFVIVWKRGNLYSVEDNTQTFGPSGNPSTHHTVGSFLKIAPDFTNKIRMLQALPAMPWPDLLGKLNEIHQTAIIPNQQGLDCAIRFDFRNKINPVCTNNTYYNCEPAHFYAGSSADIAIRNKSLEHQQIIIDLMRLDSSPFYLNSDIPIGHQMAVNNGMF